MLLALMLSGLGMHTRTASAAAPLLVANVGVTLNDPKPPTGDQPCVPNNENANNCQTKKDEGTGSTSSTVDAAKDAVAAGTVTVTLPNGNIQNGSGIGLVKKVIASDSSSVENNVLTGSVNNITVQVIINAGTDPASGISIDAKGTVTIPGGSNNLPGTGNADNSGNHNGSNPHVYTKEELEAFALTVGMDCGESAIVSNVSCWNHWVISTLWQPIGNDQQHPVCSDTSNANNVLIKDYGGWLVKLSMIKAKVDEGTYVYGDAHECGGNGKNVK
jgi:hypothetical protein